MSEEKLERAILIGVHRRGVPSWEVEDNIEELEQLLNTAGGEAVASIIHDMPSPDAGTFIGRGKVEELAGQIDALDIDMVVFDDDLTGAQVRNLEKHFKCKVMDRSGLILDIFAKRARTKEACIQVELAQLIYLRPRLTRRWQHLSRQVGGIGMRGPMRGPGETQLETDRRRMNQRISSLENQLKRIERSRATRRKGRQDIFKVAIVGYTNAGKSTLMNTLTRSDVFVEDRLFATLDPTVRAYVMPSGRKVLLIDTVGFIRKLPVGLLASFKSTLEESRQADLFLNVVDLSHPHWEEQLERTEEILRELELQKTPQVLVFNKIDNLEDPVLLEGLTRQYPQALFISALRKIRLYEIPAVIERFAEQRWERGSRSFRPDEVHFLKDFENQVKVIGRSFRDGYIHVDYLTPVSEISEESPAHD